MSSFGIKTRTNVTIEVFPIEREAEGKPLKDEHGEFILGKIPVSYKRIHNTTGNTMLYYKNYYLAHVTTTKPVNRVRFTDSNSNTYYGTTSFSNASYATTWTASWTNTTGGSVTISTIALVRRGASSDIVFCTASPAQAVADYEVMKVSWTHTHTATNSGSDADHPTVANDVLEMLRDALTGDITESVPLYSMTATGAGGSDTEILGTPYSGGSISDATTVWTATFTSPAATTQLTSYELVGSDGTSYLTKTGLTTAWAATQEITATITVTMS